MESRIPILVGSSLSKSRFYDKERLRYLEEKVHKQALQIHALEAERTKENAYIKKKLASVVRVNEGQDQVLQRQASQRVALEYKLRQEKRRTSELESQLELLKTQSALSTVGELETQLEAKQARINQLNSEKQCLEQKLVDSGDFQKRLADEKNEISDRLFKAVEARRNFEAQLTNCLSVIDSLQTENESLRGEQRWGNNEKTLPSCDFVPIQQSKIITEEKWQEGKRYPPNKSRSPISRPVSPPVPACKKNHSPKTFVSIDRCTLG